MDNSPFNKLPAELLNQIAELVLHQCTSIDIWGPKEGDDFQLIVGENRVPIKQPTAFAHACKELHRDYMPVFYSQNSFVVHTRHNEVVSCIKAFLNAIGPKNASTMPGLLVDINLGPCRHPREITRGGHARRSTAETMRRLCDTFGDSLYPSNAVDIDFTLTSIMNDFRNDTQLIRMMKGCNSTQIKALFTVARASGHQHAVILHCEDMKRSLMGQAYGIATEINPDLPIVEYIFLTRLSSLLRHLSTEYTD